MVSVMSDLKPFLGLGFSIFFWILISTTVAADRSLQELEALHLPSELQLLKSKISFLQSMIGERDYELRKKDQSILQMEKIIEEKSDKVVTLESEIAFLRQKGSSESKEYTHTRTDELEKQFSRLREEIEEQKQKKNTLEAWADKAERKINELNVKLESVNGSCHSCWLAVHLSHLQTFWYESGRPMANKAYRELLERKTQIEQWLKVQVKIIVTEWIPNLTEQWLVFTTDLEPHVRCFATKTVDMYYKVKSYAVPKAFEVFQETKEFTKPYIDQMVTVAKLRLENGVALEPYQKNIVSAYQKIINFAASYHHQVYGGWHTHWLAVRFSHLQSRWNESGRPVANKAYQKLLERKAQVWQWLDFHV